MLFSGCGTRIRTQTNRVRVCRATFTQFRNILLTGKSIYYLFEKVKMFLQKNALLYQKSPLFLKKLSFFTRFFTKKLRRRFFRAFFNPKNYLFFCSYNIMVEKKALHTLFNTRIFLPFFAFFRPFSRCLITKFRNDF